MKLILSTLFVLVQLAAFSQDTTDIYVINKTNRLIKIDDAAYAFVYRDLKSLKEIRSFNFENKTALDKFFRLCQKALDVDQGTVTGHYNVSRNRLSKNVVRVNDKNGGYTLIKYTTLDHMRKALENSK